MVSNTFRYNVCDMVVDKTKRNELQMLKP